MSLNFDDLCASILEDHFGGDAAKVAQFLLRRGCSTLPLLIKHCCLSPVKLKKCLAILIQHNVVLFNEGVSGTTEYRCDRNSILVLGRAYRYVHTAKQLYGDIAELIVECLLLHGQVCLRQVVRDTVQKLSLALSEGDGQQVEEAHVRDKFVCLADAHLICRCSMTASSEQPLLFPPLPTMNRFEVSVEDSRIGSCSPPSSKRFKREEPDATILWMVNAMNFEKLMCDQLLLRTVALRHDDTAMEVTQALLRMSAARADQNPDVPHLLTGNEILQHLARTHSLSKHTLDQYLSLLADDEARFFIKIGESGGGSYQLNAANVWKTLCRSTIESVVQERFGTTGLRMFRCLIEKHYLEQHELEAQALLSSKEAKDVLYTMLAHSMVCMKEVSKTTDFAPSKTCFLFYVSLPRIAKHLLETTYKAYKNVMQRRQFEMKSHKPLMEIVQKVEALVGQLQEDPNLDASTKAEQIREVEESYLPPPVQRSVNEHKNRVRKLLTAEIQVDSTLFILRGYLNSLQESPQQQQKKSKT